MHTFYFFSGSYLSMADSDSFGIPQLLELHLPAGGSRVIWNICTCIYNNYTMEHIFRQYLWMRPSLHSSETVKSRSNCRIPISPGRTAPCRLLRGERRRRQQWPHRHHPQTHPLLQHQSRARQSRHVLRACVRPVRGAGKRFNSHFLGLKTDWDSILFLRHDWITYFLNIS